MGSDHLASEAVDEAALVVNSVLQDDGEVAHVVDELLGSLGSTEDGDVGAVYGPHILGESHASEASTTSCGLIRQIKWLATKI